jgi:hypothetical protein
MATTATTTVTVLRTNDDTNAKLVTDGVHVTWVQGHLVRPDNTLTPSAARALANGVPYDLWERGNE